MVEKVISGVYQLSGWLRPVVNNTRKKVCCFLRLRIHEAISALPVLIKLKSSFARLITTWDMNNMYTIQVGFVLEGRKSGRWTEDMSGKGINQTRSRQATAGIFYSK